MDIQEISKDLDTNNQGMCMKDFRMKSHSEQEILTIKVRENVHMNVCRYILTNKHYVYLQTNMHECQNACSLMVCVPHSIHLLNGVELERKGYLLNGEINHINIMMSVHAQNFA